MSVCVYVCMILINFIENKGSCEHLKHIETFIFKVYVYLVNLFYSYCFLYEEATTFTKIIKRKQSALIQ